MHQTLRIAAVTLTLLAAPAFANHCPMDIKKIDAALAANPKLSASDLAEVKAMRDEGAKLHASGDHAGSMAVLDKAMQKLGIAGGSH